MSPMQKITRKNHRPFLEKWKTDASVLEIGAGNAVGGHSYKELFPNGHTFDINPKRSPDTVGDAHNMPFDDKSFDYVLCTEVLEHLHTPQQAILEMKRVLKSGGKLILTTRFAFPIHDAPNDYYRYTEYGLRHLFRDWRIEELVSETKTMSTIGALLQRIGFQTDVKGGKFTKSIIYSSAWLFDNLNWVIKKEYGDIKKETTIQQIITTGYYMVAIKE